MIILTSRLKTKLRLLEGEYLHAKKRAEGGDTTNDDLAYLEELKKENESLKEQLQEYQAYKPQVHYQ